MDLSDTQDAVVAASPRIVGFGEPAERVVNGAGHALYLAPDMDSTAPLTPDELDTIVEAIWTSVPFEPNAIRLAARDAATGDEPVDLHSAAAQLSPMRSGPFGDEGVTLTSMSSRYGDWEEPG